MYAKRNTFRRNNCDGYGTLKTPFGNFDAIRVKSELYVTDTVFLDTIGQGIRITQPVTIEYKWLGKDKGVPLLFLNTRIIANTPVILTVEYQDSLRTLDVSNDKKVHVDDFKIYPNPSPSEAFIEFDLSENQKVSLEIYDSEGKLIHTTPEKMMQGNCKIPVNYQKSGIYLLKLQIGTKFTSSKIIFE